MRRNLNPTPLPEGRTVIQFLYQDLPSTKRSWWLVVEKHGEVDLCWSDPGFDIDLYVTTDLHTMTAIWMGVTMVHRERRKIEFGLPVHRVLHAGLVGPQPVCGDGKESLLAGDDQRAAGEAGAGGGQQQRLARAERVGGVRRATARAGSSRPSCCRSRRSSRPSPPRRRRVARATAAMMRALAWCGTKRDRLGDGEASLRRARVARSRSSCRRPAVKTACPSVMVISVSCERRDRGVERPAAAAGRDLDQIVAAPRPAQMRRRARRVAAVAGAPAPPRPRRRRTGCSCRARPD